MTKFLQLSAVLALAASAAAPAFAEDLKLKFNDLDLSRPEQARLLDQRISNNAERWCNSQIDTGTRLHDSQCAGKAKAALLDALPPAARAAVLAAR